MDKQQQKLVLYNTLTRRKAEFEPLHAPHVGMYVCGPTVYGDPHLGHARSAITFDILFRYLTHLGYKVRYVRNITDVGHLEHDADEGEDKIAARARLEQLEPMEIAQKYTARYHEMMGELNVLRPSIEPSASGHIIEQIALVEKILAAGYAYESEGNVYFDIERYSRDHHYGILSGRVVEEMQAGTRTLDGQETKRNPLDFALWKKATPQHIMRWPSPWGPSWPAPAHGWTSSDRPPKDGHRRGRTTPLRAGRRRVPESSPSPPPHRKTRGTPRQRVPREAPTRLLHQPTRNHQDFKSLL